VTLEKVGILRINVKAGNASLSRICSPVAVRLAGGATGKIATVGKPDCYGRQVTPFSHSAQIRLPCRSSAHIHLLITIGY
jgi:hypothetical protein